MTKVLRKSYRNKIISIGVLDLKRVDADEASAKLSSLYKQLDEVILDYLKTKNKKFYERSKTVNPRLIRFCDNFNGSSIYIEDLHKNKRRWFLYNEVGDFPLICLKGGSRKIPDELIKDLVEEINEIECLDWYKRDYGIDRSTKRMTLLQVYNLPSDKLFKIACKHYKLNENEILVEEKSLKKKTNISDGLLMKIIDHGNI